MYYGEIAWSQADGLAGTGFTHVQVYNRGEQPLRIHHPKVEVQDRFLPSANWIEVDRETPQLDPTDLAVDQSLYLKVKLDLSRVNSQNREPRPLKATILLESVPDDRSPWELPVSSGVARLVDARHGTTGGDEPAGDRLRQLQHLRGRLRSRQSQSVARRRRSRAFSHAPFLADKPDPAMRNLVIGRDAVSFGEKDPGQLVRWNLKRWLLAPDMEWETPYEFTIPGKSDVALKRGDLIRLFLEKVIQECETRERKTFIRIGVSYPANYSPRARRRFDTIIDQLEARQRSVCRHLDDRAKARIKFVRDATFGFLPRRGQRLAIGFVYNETHYRDEIAPHLGDNMSFLLAVVRLRRRLDRYGAP